MIDLPDEYIPSGLRLREKVELEVRYGVGVQYKKDTSGMIAGPFGKLSQALEEIPIESADTIGKTFIFKLPEMKKMYKWRKGKWAKHKDAEKDLPPW